MLLLIKSLQVAFGLCAMHICNICDDDDDDDAAAEVELVAAILEKVR